MLTALSAIAAKQAHPTTKMLLKTKQFLDYMAANDEAIVMYQASIMIFTVHSNASSLSEPKSRSSVGEHFFMSTDTAFLTNNGTVHNMVQIIKQVMSSEAEAEAKTWGTLHQQQTCCLHADHTARNGPPTTIDAHTN